MPNNMRSSAVHLVRCVLGVLLVQGCSTTTTGDTAPIDIVSTNRSSAVMLDERLPDEKKRPRFRVPDEHRLHLAARTDNVDMLIRALAKEPEKLETRNLSGQTPLHISARWNSVDVARYLVEVGADIHARDVYGNTPLHLAGIDGHEEIPSILIEAGAPLDIRRRDGRTPLDLAISYNKKKLAQFLIDRGAIPNKFRLNPTDI